MAGQIDDTYVAKVLELITSSPTAAELDELLEAYATIGWYSAETQGMAESAESVRKYAEAEALLNKRNEDIKTPMVALEAWATVKTFDLKREENKRKANAKKMYNLYQAVEQCINGVKFLGRSVGV